MSWPMTRSPDVVTETTTPNSAPGDIGMSTEYRTDVDQSLYTSDIHFRLQQDSPLAGVGDPASEGDDVLQLLNSTDGELSGLSHLDAPISDSVYIVCGVLIAMVLVGLIIVLLAITISKLRKREETNNNNHTVGHGQRTLPAHQLPQLQLQTTDGSKVSFSQGHLGNGVTTLETSTTTTTIAVSAAVSAIAVAPAVAATAVNATTTATVVPEAGDSVDSASGVEDVDEVGGKVAPLELVLWSYPSQQLSPYSGTKDTLVRELPCEAPQDSKGLRKNLRGKWKRLVKRKPEDSCSIPPELRDQLKQIYVY